MNEFFYSTCYFMVGLVLVESVIYVGGLYLISRLSSKDHHDSTDSNNS
jgi:hypothetical protein